MEFINGECPAPSDESRNEILENISEVLNDHFGIWSMSAEEYDEEDLYLIGFGVGGPA
jgi:hypothetical protein